MFTFTAYFYMITKEPNGTVPFGPLLHTFIDNNY